MKLITISGLDGSGKSTQIEMLKNHLESQERRVFYFHAVKFSLANKMTKIFNFCHPERLPAGEAGSRGISSENNEIAAPASPKLQRGESPVTPRNDMPKSITHANWLQIWLRKIFLKIDIWRFNHLRKCLRKSGYDYILSDRYFYDSVINIEYLENNCHRERSACLLKRQEAISDEIAAPASPKLQRGESPVAPRNDKIIKPDVAIYLQTDPEIIMQRERKPDQGIEYLKKKKELYESKISVWNMRVIDGNQDKNTIFESIKNVIHM